MKFSRFRYDHDRDIQAILGHGDVRTTGLYEHVDLGSKQKALEKVESRLFADMADSTRCRQICRRDRDFVVINTSITSGSSDWN